LDTRETCSQYNFAQSGVGKSSASSENIRGIYHQSFSDRYAIHAIYTKNKVAGRIAGEKKRDR
jgi:hypothetical protein